MAAILFQCKSDEGMKMEPSFRLILRHNMEQGTF